MREIILLNFRTSVRILVVESDISNCFSFLYDQRKLKELDIVLCLNTSKYKFNMFNGIPKDVLMLLVEQICLPDVCQMASTCKTVSIHLRLWLDEWYPYMYLINSRERWLQGFRLLCTLIPMQVIPGQFYYPWVTWNRFPQDFDLTTEPEDEDDCFDELLRIDDNYMSEGPDYESDHVTLFVPNNLESSLIKISNKFFKYNSEHDIELNSFNKRFKSFLEAYMLENHKLGYESCTFCLFYSGIKGLNAAGFSTDRTISAELNLKHVQVLDQYVSKIRLDTSYKSEPEFSVKICLSVLALQDFFKMDPEFYTSSNEQDMKTFARFKLLELWKDVSSSDVLKLCQLT